MGNSNYITTVKPHIDPSTYRESSSSPNRSVSGQVVPQGRVNYNYPDPINMAKGTIANLDENEISNLKAQLFSAGYFKRSQMSQNPYTIENGMIKFLPERNDTLVTALVNAMKDANNSGVEWQEIAASRQNEIAAGIRGTYFGETALDSATKDKTNKNTSSTTFTTYLTPRDKSDASLDKQFQEIYGRLATSKEKNDFYKILSKKQSDPKNAQKYTTRTVNGHTYVTQTNGGVSLEDEIMNYAISKVNFTDTSHLGTGKANQTVVDLKSLASEYGMSLSKKDIVKYATGVLNGEIQTTSLKDSFANYAKNHYTAYANQISADKSVKDIAQTYINRKAQILEIDPESLGIKDVENALIGKEPMTYQEFDNSVKQDVRYQNTNAAKSNALDFATSIARAFGYGV